MNMSKLPNYQIFKIERVEFGLIIYKYLVLINLDKTRFIISEDKFEIMEFLENTNCSRTGEIKKHIFKDLFLEIKNAKIIKDNLLEYVNYKKIKIKANNKRITRIISKADAFKIVEKNETQSEIELDFNISNIKLVNSNRDFIEYGLIG